VPTRCPNFPRRKDIRVTRIVKLWLRAQPSDYSVGVADVTTPVAHEASASADHFTERAQHILPIRVEISRRAILADSPITRKAFEKRDDSSGELRQRHLRCLGPTLAANDELSPDGRWNK
jgi:hypothetical protein